MIIDFSDTATAFKHRTNSDLKRAYWLFSAMGSIAMVKIGKVLVTLSFALRLPIKGLIRMTIFRQFCAGESVTECGTAIEQLSKTGVKSILDYSVEGKESENEFDRTVDAVIETIHYASKSPWIPLSVFKPTGMGRFALLEKVSLGESLDGDELLEWERIVARFDRIASAAFEARTPVMVDAEESWIQNAVDHLVSDLMLKYNRDAVIVMNTLQMYRHDRLAFLKKSIEHAIEHDYWFGVKIVRGAYMEKERLRAKRMSYEDPIQPSKEATDQDYDHAIALLMKHLDRVNFVAGSHNEYSCQLLIDQMEKQKLEASDSRIWFAQLYGMSDHISYNLVDKGFNVVKYLPFGPIQDVMPYLIRRAEENTSVRGQTGRELALIKKELNRRRKLAKA